jgi:hypothetical protein
MKALLGLLLSLSLGSCPVAMSWASAVTADAHGCCPAPEPAPQDSDCCVTAAAPSTVAFAAPSFAVVALPHAGPSLGAAGADAVPPPPALAPPGASPSAGPSSRAPPAVLA